MPPLGTTLGRGASRAEGPGARVGGRFGRDGIAGRSAVRAVGAPGRVAAERVPEGLRAACGNRVMWTTVD